MLPASDWTSRAFHAFAVCGPLKPWELSTLVTYR
jgi:hypothetical protein